MPKNQQKVTVCYNKGNVVSVVIFKITANANTETRYCPLLITSLFFENKKSSTHS